MRIGFVGLGKMGAQIIAKLIGAGHQVVAYDVNPAALANAATMGALAVNSREELVKQLGERPIIWLMIPADYVQAEIEEFVRLLTPGSVLIDGGNSHFRASISHADMCQTAQIQFVDVGTSGGVMGLQNGFSMTIGGQTEVISTLDPVFAALAAPYGGYYHAGPTGYGHYIKMVHNGIEYAAMQAYAEGYDLLKYGPLPNIDLAKVAATWSRGSIISSTLNNLIAGIMAEDPELEGVDGYVAASGEGKWTYETAQQADLSMPALKAALEVREASQYGAVYYPTKLLAALRHAFGGHPINRQ